MLTETVLTESSLLISRSHPSGPEVQVMPDECAPGLPVGRAPVPAQGAAAAPSAAVGLGDRLVRRAAEDHGGRGQPVRRGGGGAGRQ